MATDLRTPCLVVVGQTSKRIDTPGHRDEIILTGRRLEAKQVPDGFVNRVTTAGAALRGARELTQGIVECSPTSVRTSLRTMTKGRRSAAGPVEAVRNPSPALDDLLVNEDPAEGVTAFAQKRWPTWRNR